MSKALPDAPALSHRDQPPPPHHPYEVPGHISFRLPLEDWERNFEASGGSP